MGRRLTKRRRGRNKGRRSGKERRGGRFVREVRTKESKPTRVKIIFFC